MRTFRVTQGKDGQQKCAIHANHVAAVVQLVQLDSTDHCHIVHSSGCCIMLAGAGHGTATIYPTQSFEEVMELWLAALGDSR